MDRRLINGIGIVACLAFLGAGLAVSPVCDGGAALILFGAAIGCLGLVVFREGAWATAIPFALITLTLVAGGLYGWSASGCSF